MSWAPDAAGGVTGHSVAVVVLKLCIVTSDHLKTLGCYMSIQAASASLEKWEDLTIALYLPVAVVGCSPFRACSALGHGPHHALVCPSYQRHKLVAISKHS